MYKITKICHVCKYKIVEKQLFSESKQSDVIKCKCGLDMKFINLKKPPREGWF